jgi:hypothetical protein
MQRQSYGGRVDSPLTGYSGCHALVLGESQYFGTGFSRRRACRLGLGREAISRNFGRKPTALPEYLDHSLRRGWVRRHPRLDPAPASENGSHCFGPRRIVTLPRIPSVRPAETPPLCRLLAICRVCSKAQPGRTIQDVAGLCPGPQVDSHTRPRPQYC